MQLRLLPLLLTLAVAARAEVVINELMYHPSSENPAEEYIELFNNGAAAVDVSGWQFTSGVAFTFPAATSVPAGGYLVVTANPAVFHAKYSAVTNYVASIGWTGQLSNSSNNLVLKNPSLVTMDSVDYADDGDWATRQKDTVLDYGHRGWGWTTGADGGGKSLELINPLFSNAYAQNWTASTATNGTPGAANSVAAANIAPVILDAAHFPLVPKSTDAVTVNVRVLNDDASVPAVTLHWKLDASGAFTSVTMFDDGTHTDGLAGDGVFGASIPAQANDAIVEFYFEVVDGGSHKRFWPAPALSETGALLVDGTGQPTTSPHALYAVDNTVYAGAEPIYRLVMKAAESAELTQINTDTPVINGVDQTYSHAKMNTTFISIDGTGSEVRYLCATRNRGNGSRSAQPQSYNLTTPNDLKWNGITSLNLNTQHTPYQLFGSAIFRKAGLSGPESRAVQVRVNNVNPASSASAPAYGFYVCNEVQNSDFADHHFPLDSSGNIYRGQRIDSNGGADLRDQSTNPDPRLADPLVYNADTALGGTGNYYKHTNTSENDWSDLIDLTQKLAKGHFTGTYGVSWDADYVPAVQAVMDVNEAMTFMAVNTIADNSETNITMGDGDDYYLYFGVTDPRAKFVQYDLDTVFGRSGTSNSATHGMFRMAVSASGPAGPTPLYPFMRHPSFAPIYFSELKRLLDGPFLPARFDPVAQEILGGVVSQTVIDSIKSFNATRVAYINGLIPTALTATSALTVTNGFPRSTTATVALSGKANPIITSSVKVNGVAATYNPWTANTSGPVNTSVGDWSIASAALNPGINRILVQAFNANNVEVERTTYDVWYDDSTAVNKSGTGVTETWTPAAGPYQITAAYTVPNGVTLTIQPGTTVYVASGVNITVANGGRILAEGTETQHIRFTKTPGSTNWGGLTINGGAGSPETRIAYADFDSNGSTAIVCAASTVYLDHLTFGNTAVAYLHLDGASFLVSNCVFPPLTASVEGVHGTLGVKSGGYGIVRDCFFGKATGYNDQFDFTGGNRNLSQPILQVINCVFMGSDDDGLDLDGTDTWVEGNIFVHFHKNGATPDSSSAVSGGNDSGNTSEITVIGNLFFDVDQAATAKQGNFYTFINNTVVHQNRTAGIDTDAGVLNLFDTATAYAAGIYAEGNIIYDAQKLVRNDNPPTATVTFNNNILSQAWSGAGGGNSLADPRLTYIPAVSETNFPTFQAAQIVRQWFALLPGSPGIGTGPNGVDKGGVIPLGANVSGQPSGTTNQTTATLVVGTNRSGSGISAAGFPNGSGFTHYKWKLDAGAFSAETPIASPISLAGLANGTHTVSVIGKNDAGTYQDDSKFGPDVIVTVSKPWTVDTGYVPPAAAANVRINEVLAKNGDYLLHAGTFPDLIELYNAGTVTADIGGMGLTDNSGLPYKYTIPAGTMLTGGAYLLIYADSASGAGELHTGFSLKQSGDTLTLSKSVANGGGVQDVVPFGAQLADYSIGRRVNDGQWDLCVPTFTGPNIVAAQGNLAGVVINEWLADAGVLVATDFIELYNPDTKPVNLGLGYLTDNPVEYPTRHQLRQLTFLGPGGYVSFKADNDTNQGPDHLAFKLDPLQGEIGLFNPSLTLIDNVVYGPQSTDVSEGRTPNGSSTIAFFNQPTPGGPNPGVSSGSTTVVNLIPANQSWKHQSSSTDYSAVFYPTAYNDTAWPSGLQTLYIETDALANAEGFVKTTALPVDASNANLPFNTTYFRTHFTYSGSLAGVTLSAKIMLDDGAVIYLNGFEATRVRMDAGAVNFGTISNTNIGNAVVEAITIPADHLVVGDNVLAVEVHQQHAAGAQTSSDIVWAMKLDATIPVAGSTSAVVLNEVLANNVALQNPDGSYAGWIELYNPSGTGIDVSDMSLTNDTGDARKWVFPAGSSVPANGYLVIYFNPLAAQSATNTAFALNPAGDGVFLFRNLADSGGLQDSVVFGQQVPDRSVGRVANGTGPFTLTTATRGALNSAAGLGAIGAVKINEWLALPPAGAGWFELHNSGAAPVLLSGYYLTDNLIDRTKHLIPPLTFIGGTGNSGNSRWLQLIADNDSGATPNHVNFTLNPAGEALGVFSATGVQLESIAFSAQTAGISGGRLADGTATITTLNPTPGSANQPLSQDTDGDGIPDWWENLHGLNAGNPADAALDTDGDGQSNKAEYLAGTDPRNANDTLRASITSVVPGQMHIQFTAQANVGYTIQYKNLLTDASWLRLSDIAAQSSAHAVDYTDSPGANTKRFYRVVTPQQP